MKGLSDELKQSANNLAAALSSYGSRFATKATGSLDRTYIGRIAEIETLDSGVERYKVAYGNLIGYVTLNSGIHYLNEVVRIYVPNGDITNAYGESVDGKDATRIIISKNQMVFESDIDVESFSVGDSGEPIASVNTVTVNKVINLVRDSNTKHPLNYGNLSPQNRIYQSFFGDFFSIILMVFIIRADQLRLFIPMEQM